MSNLVVSSSPHIRSNRDTRALMLDVIIALILALGVGVYQFGLRALMLIVVCVASCVFFEWGYQKLMKKQIRIGDLSAVVTGLLLAMTLSVNSTWWMAVIASAFAIIVVKQLYGGIGKNFMNPALAGRIFLVSWLSILNTWTAPGNYLPVFGSTVDAVTVATPLSYLKNNTAPAGISVLDCFMGNIGGCIGEVSALALIIGGLYLVWRKVISPRIPLCYIGTVAVLTFIFPRLPGQNLTSMLYELCTGGLMLGAIFMATDYVTSPVTKKGQIVFGIGCGLLTVFIRYFGGYPEGVAFSILIMNVCVWLIDKYMRPRKFGEVAKKK